MKRTTPFALILWLALLQGLAPLLHAHVGHGGHGQAIHTHALPVADHADPAQPHADASGRDAAPVIGMADEHRPSDVLVVADAALALKKAPIPAEGSARMPPVLASAGADQPAPFVLPWPQAPPAHA
jgi:hypothetical protein